MACRYSREAADTEWPQPSEFSSPTEQSLATPQTGQTWSRLYRVGATHYHRADNDYGQFTITNSVRPALSLWLQSEDKHTMKLPDLTGDLRYREPLQPSGTYILWQFHMCTLLSTCSSNILVSLFQHIMQSWDSSHDQRNMLFSLCSMLCLSSPREGVI